MNKSFLFLFFLMLIPFSVAQVYPSYHGYVNDFAGVISPSAESKLTNVITNLEKETSAEIAVVTVSSLGDNTIDQYAVELFEKWGIGKKNADNGILILVAPNEQKVRIEVGYGLEGAINDAKAGRIIRNFMTPQFKKGDFSQGLIDGTDAIAALIRNEPVPTTQTDSDSDYIGAFIFLIIFFIIIFAIVAKIKPKKGKTNKRHSTPKITHHETQHFSGGKSGGGGASGGW